MNSDTESAFIKAFFPKNRHERLLYELSKPKLRADCLFNLQHSADAACKTVFPFPIHMTETRDKLRSQGAPSEAYVLSRNEEYDGQLLRLKDIYQNEHLLKYLTGLICIPDKLAVLSSEETGSILLTRGITAK